MSLRVVAVVLAASLVAIRSAYAEDRGLAVLVGASDGDPIVLKISDELRALGFDVEVAPHGSDRARIRRRANREDAVAVVLVDERDIEVHVVTAEDVRARRFSHRAADTSTSALAAVEVVRGYLVPVERASNIEPPMIPERATAHADTETRSLSARLSGGFVSAGSFPTQSSVTLGGAQHFGRLAIEVSALAAIPRADAWRGGVDVGVQFAPLGYTRPVSFSVGIGAMGLAVAYKEDAKKYTTEAAAVPHAGIAVRAYISQSLSARLDGMFGVSIPSPEFKSKTGSDIRFGSSVAALSVGIETAW